jgi:hypothetical protein
MKHLPLLQCLAAVSALFTAVATAQVNWEAYNDHHGGTNTSANTSTIAMRGAGTTGFLRNFATGADLPVTMTVEEENGPSDDFGANATPNPGSPADVFFTGKCTIGGAAPDDGIPGLKNSLSAVIRLRFSNLDPTKRYKFRATSCRGNVGYVDRWSRYKIIEVDGYTNAHTLATVEGAPMPNLITADTFLDAELGPDEVALNSGNNLEGSMIGWDNINPGADGTFAIEEKQFIGTAPFGSAVAGPYGYGLSVMYLAEVSSGPGVGTITKVSTVGGNFRIEWTGAGTLQSSDNLFSWTNLPIGVVSPYEFPVSGAQRKFFRLVE